ncbi:repa, partial [Clostridioides difficile]
PEKQIRQDADGFLERLDSLTEDEENHFTKEDVKDALEALKADNKLLSTMASREWIEKQTKDPIPPNKRNGRKQAIHVKYMNKQRAIKDEMGECTKGRRPDKA